MSARRSLVQRCWCKLATVSLPRPSLFLYRDVPSRNARLAVAAWLRKRTVLDTMLETAPSNMAAVLDRVGTGRPGRLAAIVDVEDYEGTQMWELMATNPTREAAGLPFYESV